MKRLIPEPELRHRRLGLQASPAVDMGHWPIVENPVGSPDETQMVFRLWRSAKGYRKACRMLRRNGLAISARQRRPRGLSPAVFEREEGWRRFSEDIAKKFNFPRRGPPPALVAACGCGGRIEGTLCGPSDRLESYSWLRCGKCGGVGTAVALQNREAQR